MEDGLFYSGTALLNRLLFYSESCDLCIFVEDENKEYIYENIFGRMLQKEAETKNIMVFPAGGKKAVEKAYMLYGEEIDNKPIFYLVDGDFDLILDYEMIYNSHYIYLERYNIESYLIEEKAVLRYMSGKMKKPQREITQQINFDEWEDSIYQKLTRLFIDFVVMKAEVPSEKSVGTSIDAFFLENGNVNDNKIDDYEEKIKQKTEGYQNLYELMTDKYNDRLCGDAKRLICGKYLLSSLAKYLRFKTQCNFKKDDFIFFLVSTFDLKKLDYVKDRIYSIIQK